MGGSRGVSGVSGNPLGVSQIFPQLLFTANDCGHMLTQCGFQQACQWSCRPPYPVQTQLSSISVQQADAEPPEKQRQIQVMAKRPVFNAQLYTLASCSMSATA